MLCSGRLLLDSQSANEKRLCFVRPALGGIQHSQVAHRGCCDGMLWSQGRLPYSDSPLPQVLRVAWPILEHIQFGQLIESIGCLNMVCSKRALANRDCPAIDRFGLGVTAEDKVNITEVAQGPCH